MTNTQKSVNLWFPNIFDLKGGIQVYSSFLLKALQNSDLNLDYQVFLKHDTSLSPNFDRVIAKRFHFAGKYPLSLRTPAFAAQLMINGLLRRPHLIIATHFNFTVAAYWLKKLTGIRYWTIAHGIEAWNINHPTLQTALHHADRILAVSSYTRDRLLAEQNLDPNRVSILPNTFDHHVWKIAEKPDSLLKRHQLQPQQPIILTVSRLSSVEPYKGYNQILDALPQIRAAIPNIRYIIVGNGDDLPRLQELVSQRQLADCVTFAGFIPDAELNDYYNLCDLFALPSKGEGFGIVYLESLACGKPTLGGDRDGAIDAMCHGELGALVNPNDVEAIAKTAIEILQGNYPHPLIYQPEALRQKVIEHFSFESFQTNLDRQLKTANWA
jgi:glycosyltransferase involved in cell wall biosynthesis